MKVKWKFWKSSKSKKAAKAAELERKRATELSTEPAQMQSMLVEDSNVHSVKIDDNWRPPAPASGISWERREDVRYEDDVHSQPYDPTDAFGTMDGLLHEEEAVQQPVDSPPSVNHGFNQRGHHTRIIQSLSTVSAGAEPPFVHGSTTGGTALEVDSMVRQSMNTRGQPISVGIVDPYDYSQPVYHKSFAAETGHGVLTESPRSINRQASLVATEREFPKVKGLSPVASSPRSIRSPTIASLRTFPSPPRSLRVQSPTQQSHQSRSPSIQEAIPPLPLSAVTNDQSHYETEPETRFSHPSPEATELGLHFKPQTPLAQVENLPPKATFDVRSVASAEGAQFSRTNTSQSGSVRSRTYQRALNDPIPLKDPLPKVQPQPIQLVDPPMSSNYAPLTTPVYQSGGAALADANRALYGKHRHATERFYWNLPSSHDSRVEEILSWVEGMQLPLAHLGARLFLETRSRGGLLMNVDYRTGENSTEPAVDWFTFAQAKKTYDKVIQESIGSYDPASTTLVFVFLTSRSKNSIAIWRRRLPLPSSTIAQMGQQLMQLKEDMKTQPIVVQIEPTPDFPLGKIAFTASKPPVPRPITRGKPLIFTAQQHHQPRPFDSTPSPPPQVAAVEVLAPSASLLRPNTTATVHEFPPGTHHTGTRLHVFGESPASTASGGIPPPFVIEEVQDQPQKKRRWWRRVFGGGGKRPKKPKPVKLAKPQQQKRKSRMTVDWD